MWTSRNKQSSGKSSSQEKSSSNTLQELRVISNNHQQEESQSSSSASSSKGAGKSMFLRKSKGKRSGGSSSSSSFNKPAPSSKASSSSSAAAAANVNMEDTSEGVEVSFDQKQQQQHHLHHPDAADQYSVASSSVASASVKSGGSSSKRKQHHSSVPVKSSSSSEPVVSMPQFWKRKEKVYRTRYSTRFPAFSASETSLEQVQAQVSQWRPNPKHRLPLLGHAPADMKFANAVALLQNCHTSTAVSETKAVQEELRHLTAEVDALQRDRAWMESTRSKWQLAAAASVASSPTTKSQQKQLLGSPSSSAVPKQHTATTMEWDANRLLDTTTMQADLTKAERQQLQAKRGVCFTVSIANAATREAFLTKCCGYKGSSSSSSALKNLLSKSSSSSPKNGSSISSSTVTVSPANSNSSSSIGTSNIRHVSLLENNNTGSNSGSNNKKSPPASSFFLSRDSGTIFLQGRLPSKLYRRLQDNASSESDIHYLECGPLGSYYCEFRSGKIWWGSAVADDVDFHSILSSWDVHRVFFGPVTTVCDSKNIPRMSSSWLIVSREGQVAWKNVPSRLHNQLERRLAHWAAPAEVMLGQGDSYFVRYLDGTVDYCLPASMARVCEHIEARGGQITSMTMANDNDYIIRHTELKR
jgi:hypothetical protein